MMDRGRDGRRSGADRGPASAPRRPRTSGFKDAAVGEDCDDTMDDDLHNARLRERPKKDSKSLMSGKRLVSPSLVSIPRIKRKRQGLHEIQGQARGNLPDELEETRTYDSEMGGSEEDDDDDLPPAPIPRRPVKSRPQGKLEEISVRNDLPTVPRKARSVLKRAQESPPPPPVAPEILPHPPPPAVASPNGAAPSRTLSSSSGVVALKPRRRTKSSGSKPKAPKLLKVSTRTVSEEVEVAEALFDLARMIPPSALDRKMDSKLQYKSEAKSLASVSVQITSAAAQPSNGTATPPSLMLVVNTTSTWPSGASPAAAASPVLSPSPSAAAMPPEEAAPKRKGPQVRTCPEEGVLPLQAALVASTANVMLSDLPGVMAAPESRELDQVEEHLVGIAEEGTVKTEATIATGCRSSSTPAPSSPSRTPVLSVATVSMQCDTTVEKNYEISENKNAKGDVTRTSSSNENDSSYATPPLDGNPEPAKSTAPIPGIQEVDAGTTSSSLTSDSVKQLDAVKRSVQLAPDGELDQVNKFDIDLMAPPSKAAVSFVHERKNGVAGMPVHERQEKPLVDLTVISPVASVLIEKDKEDRQEQQEREEMQGEMEKERSEDRERTDLSKPPPQQASKGVKPESRPSKSGKASSVASSLLASSAALPISPGVTGWPGAMSPLGYFPAAAAWPAASMTGASSVDKNPRTRVSPFSNMPPQQPWKRCASHVWIAHFIDAQQQINRHPFFGAGLYGGKSYNQNMSLLPPEALYGSGGVQVASVPGPPMSSAIALGAGLGVGERPFGVTTMSGAKDRERERIAEATFMEVFGQNAVPQQQHPILSLQPGAAFGSSGVQPGTILMASSGLSTEVVNGVADGGANIGNPALPGSSSGPGIGSVMAGSLGLAGGPGIVASNRVAAAIQEQYLHAMMQNRGLLYHQYPGSHFGPTFNSLPAKMGTQQAGAQYFASVPFFGQQLVSPSQQSAHQTSVVASGGGPVPLQNKQQQQQQGVHRFPPTESPHPSQPPSHSSSQHQVQSQSDTDGWDGPSGKDNGSVVESKFPILHRHLYSQGSPSVANLSIPPAAVQTLPSQQDFSIFAASGKQNKWEHRQQQQQQHASAQQLQKSQPPPSLSSQQHPQQKAAAQRLQINLKGVDPQSSQAFSAMTMTAAMSRGTVGPGPLGLAPVAAVMAPQGHAVLQSIADAVHIHPPQSPHHSAGSCAPYPSLIHQQQQWMQQLQFQQQQQQHRSVQMQRGPMGVEEGHMVADASNHTSNTGARWERDPGQDRKMSVKQPIGSSSPLSRVDLDTSPTRGNTHNETPTLNSIASSSAIMSSHPTGHVAQGGVPLPLARAIQPPKQSMVRTKGITGPNTTSRAALNQSNMVSYVDHGPPAAPSLTAKVSGPGVSLAGQTAISASHGARQTPIAQHPCLNLSQRTSMGSNPTSPGTDSKLVLAAAMAKVQNPESKLQQSVMPQVAPHATSQMSSAVSGSPASSSTAALSPLPAGSKSSAAVGAKHGSFGKGSSSFPTANKSVGAVPGNPALTPALSQQIILGHSHSPSPSPSPSPSLGNKSLSAKLPQQQQQYLQPGQMHKQQNPQQQQQQQQLFQHQQVQMTQQQQFPNSQSQPLPLPPPQRPQQLLQQPQHSPPLTQAQVQQNLTHQPLVQHLNQQQSASSNNGNIANSGQSSSSEVINDPQAANATPAPSNLSASALPGSGSQRRSNSSAPAFLHPRCSSSQELDSPGQLNSMRPMQVPASIRTATSPPAASPSPIPQLSSVQQIGGPTQVKSSSGQFMTGSSHDDNTLSQSSLMQSVTPSSTMNGSPNHSVNNNISNGCIGSDVQ